MFAGLPLRLPSSCKISKFVKINVSTYRYDFPDSDCLNLEWFSSRENWHDSDSLL